MFRRTTTHGPHPVDLHVGARVRARRKALGLNLEALAAELGVAYQQLQKYETGANRISVSMLYEIARALRTPVADFYGGLPQVLARDGEPAKGAPQIDDILATRGGGELLEAFLAMPSRLREPFVALARGVAEGEDRETCAKPRRLPTWR
ncbi:helix-turn-helix domain-containing protein [Phenylobacterium sp.]|uniref:helix-turn-helix domain-containing protein n=1 Tax=Phenylobacterium sp. TaxID=1871053 RepID=UPI002FC9C1BB